MTRTNVISPLDSLEGFNGSVTYETETQQCQRSPRNQNWEQGTVHSLVSVATSTIKAPFIRSIRFSIMLLTSIVVIISVVILSIIWLSSLLPANLEWSTIARGKEFDKIASTVMNMLSDVAFSSDIMKGQLMYLLDFSNSTQIEQVTYQTFKVESFKNPGLVVTGK